MYESESRSTFACARAAADVIALEAAASRRARESSDVAAAAAAAAIANQISCDPRAFALPTAAASSLGRPTRAK